MNMFDEDEMECVVSVRARVMADKDGIVTLGIETTTLRPDDVKVLERLLRKIEALMESVQSVEE